MMKLTKKNFLSSIGITFLSSLSLVSVGSTNTTAYINGNIYTGESNQNFATSLIVTDGVFSYVGDSYSKELALTQNAKIIDLKGATVVPGFYDSHIHPVGGGEKLLFMCNFSQQADLPEILKKVESCAKTTPDGSWIVGGSWKSELLEQASAKSLAKLDKASNGRPVVLSDFSHHNIWANSLAVSKAGLTKEHLNEYGDLVKTDSNGDLTGFFIEQAGELINKAIPERSENDYALSAKKAIEQLNMVGIIGIKDSYVSLNEYKAWAHLENEGKLTANIALSWGWPSDKSLTQEQKQVLFKETVKPSFGHINSMFAKISLDGIPPTKTAAMLAPYHPVDEKQIGTLNYTEHSLAETLTWLDQNGFTTQVHAVGDRAARTMLDAVEDVRKHNGDSGLRHEIAHACIVDPADIKRFSELNVVPNFSPIFWYPSPIQTGLEMLLGKNRATRNCEMKTLSENGSLPTGGSDWPVSEDVNPWKAIESMITRKDPNGKRPNDTLWPEQRVSIEQALSMYTINGAMAQRIAEKSGSIKVGKSADMLIIDRNVFDIEPANIGETQIIETIFEGNTIYKKD